MFRYLHFVLMTAILFGLAAGTHAQTFNSVVVFGDSLSDSGNIAQYYTPIARSYGFEIPAGTSFTTNPDPVWAEIVSRTFGAPGTNSLAGGTNYAWSGACVNTNGPCEENSVPRTEQQINQHLSGESADPDTLYMIWGGVNDIRAVAGDNPSDPQSALDGTLEAAGAYVNQIRSLKDAGARYVVVLNLPDVGITPNSQRTGAADPSVPSALLALTRAYNEALGTGISSQEHGIVPVNIFALMNEIVSVSQKNPVFASGGLEL